MYWQREKRTILARFTLFFLRNPYPELALLSKLVQFYPKEIGWNYSFHEALMGEYHLPEDNMLSRLAEKHADLKDILNEIIFLHNSNTQTLSEDNALVKMAKERQHK